MYLKIYEGCVIVMAKPSPLTALDRRGVRALAADIRGIDPGAPENVPILDRWARRHHMTKVSHANAVLRQMLAAYSADLIQSYGLQDGQPRGSSSSQALEAFTVQHRLYWIRRAPVANLLAYRVTEFTVGRLTRHPLATIGQVADLADLTVVSGLGAARVRTVNIALVELGLRDPTAAVIA